MKSDRLILFSVLSGEVLAIFGAKNGAFVVFHGPTEAIEHYNLLLYSDLDQACRHINGRSSTMKAAIVGSEPSEDQIRCLVAGAVVCQRNHGGDSAFLVGLLGKLD